MLVIRTLILALVLLFAALPAAAQTLTGPQLATLKAAALADPTAAAYIASGDDQSLADWFNADAPGPVAAWVVVASRAALFEATPITQFDALTAGKRDAWRLLLDNSPADFSRQKMRAAVLDIWAAAQANSILSAMTENASRAENALGGTSTTSGTVTALRRSWVGDLNAGTASLVRVSP